MTSFIMPAALLEEALNKGNAHVPFEDAVAGLPQKLLGDIPDGLPYSLWQLIEHVRLTQADILEFCRNPEYVAPDWPEDYWPKEKAPGRPEDLQKSVDAIISDRKAFVALLHAAGEGIFTPLAHGEGHSLFREALLIIDHTSYHTGEIIVIRRLLGIWPAAR